MTASCNSFDALAEMLVPGFVHHKLGQRSFVPGRPSSKARGGSRGLGLLDQSAGWAVATLSEHLADRQGLLTMEFKKFLAEVMLLACQIVRGFRT